MPPAEPVYFKVIVTSGSTSLVRVQISLAITGETKNRYVGICSKPP